MLASPALANTPLPTPAPTTLLSRTTSMPGSSFSLPARQTCPGAFLANGSICAVCYADGRHRYRWTSVQRAQAARFAWTLWALEAGTFVPVLIGAIAARSERYVRIHDSGDFFHPAYALAWRDIARALPAVQFWAPTRSWAIAGRLRPAEDALLAALRTLAALPNVVIRPSALVLEDPPPVVAGLAAGSTVTADRARVTCPKSLTVPAHCGSCRVCWDAPAVPVTHLRH